MTRRLLKAGVAGALGWSGATALYRRMTGTGGVPVVLGYHRVVEDFRAAAANAIPAMLVSTATLEKQLDWLCRRFEVVGLDELAGAAPRGRGARPRAAITFDDAYVDVYHNAFPLLLRKGIPFAVFAVTDMIGSHSLYVHDELYYLLARSPCADLASKLGRTLLNEDARPRGPAAGPAEPPDDAFALARRLLESVPQDSLRDLLEKLRCEAQVPDSVAATMVSADWSMLLEMRSTGAVIGCHSRSHPLLTNESPDRVREEIAGARVALEHGLGETVEHFAYPDGAFDADVVEAVANAGFRFGYGTCMHRDAVSPRLTIPRRLLWERSSLNALGGFSPAVMDCQVNGFFDAASRCRAQHGRAGAART